MYPPMMYLHEDIARSLIQYRFDRLDGARSKAKSYQPPYNGTMFPWESASTGVETCPDWAPTGLR
jgi:protein-glucosylgalactosylhydroxylysine glucosidase